MWRLLLLQVPELGLYYSGASWAEQGLAAEQADPTWALLLCGQLPVP